MGVYLCALMCMSPCVQDQNKAAIFSVSLSSTSKIMQQDELGGMGGKKRTRLIFKEFYDEIDFVNSEDAIS